MNRSKTSNYIQSCNISNFKSNLTEKSITTDKEIRCCISLNIGCIFPQNSSILIFKKRVLLLAFSFFFSFFCSVRNWNKPWRLLTWNVNILAFWDQLCRWKRLSKDVFGNTKEFWQFLKNKHEHFRIFCWKVAMYSCHFQLLWCKKYIIYEKISAF